MTAKTPQPKPSAHIQLFSRTSEADIFWRLLSGNNREIGRSSDSYADVESCVLEIKELQQSLDEAESGVRRFGLSEWRWRLTLEGQQVAASSRGFDRLIRCEQGLAQFIVHFPQAEIGTALMISEARRW